MTKYTLRMLLSALMMGMFGVSAVNAEDMPSGTMQQKMAPANGAMEMQEETMQKGMKKAEMESKEGTKDEMMENPSMESSQGMSKKPMIEKGM